MPFFVYQLLPRQVLLVRGVGRETEQLEKGGRATLFHCSCQGCPSNNSTRGINSSIQLVPVSTISVWFLFLFSPPLLPKPTHHISSEALAAAKQHPFLKGLRLSPSGTNISQATPSSQRAGSQAYLSEILNANDPDLFSQLPRGGTWTLLLLSLLSQCSLGSTLPYLFHQFPI